MRERFKLSKATLEKALKGGSVESQIMVCLLIGVAGTDKTHTIHLLLQKDPPEQRNSTTLAERPVRAIRVSALSGNLQEVSADDLDNMLADTVAVGIHSEKRPFFCDCFFDEVDPYERLSGDEKTCCFYSTSHKPESELEEVTKSALDDTAHKISASTAQFPPLKHKWIYLIDSGGQIEFLEVLPAFLHHTSVCLFVTKLSEKLSDHPKIEYFENGKPVSEPITCTFTNEEIIMRCVQTIQSQHALQNGNANQASQLVVVGTHRDLKHKCLESIDEKNEKLLRLLHPAFDQSFVFYGQQLKELIFPVNAKTPGPQDRTVAGELTNRILNAASNTEPRKTPISWFKFEQHLQKLTSHGTRIMSREQCFQVARLFHLSEDDFDAALDHLASFCVIHYYCHLLPKVVFIDPHFLVGMISEIVKYHYKIRHVPDMGKATGGELMKFRNEGCITLMLLKEIPMEYTDFFTPADLLELMEDRLIITRHIGRNEYFMPCLLRSMDSEEIDQQRLRSSSPVAPLAIHFSCGWVPHGMYCSLVAFLRSQKNSPWKLSPHPGKPTEPLCLTRNCIQFQLPKRARGSLILIDSYSHFEVHINAPRNVCDKLCPSIWQTLSKGLQKAKETLRYHNLEEPKRAFLCPHGNDYHTRRPHLASPADDFNNWSCDLSPATEFGDLTDEHLVWFPERRGNNNDIIVFLCTFTWIMRIWYTFIGRMLKFHAFPPHTHTLVHTHTHTHTHTYTHTHTHTHMHTHSF